MMVLSIEERVFLIEYVFRCNGEYTQDVKAKFLERFPNTVLPFRHTVRSLIDKFRETGSVEDAPKSGRNKILTADKLGDISDRMARSPTKSVRRLAIQSGISVGSAHSAVRKSLALYPYKVTAMHELKETDKGKRLQYCMWFKDFVIHYDNILEKTFFTDEAWFNLSGYVNSQNRRIWCAENPHEYVQKPLHSQKIGVWCAISKRRIIGPIFFNDNVNSDLYLDHIIHPFIGELNEEERESAWFQQDGATAHTSNKSLRVLRQHFGERIISKGIWPSRSPDLTPPDYYLWGKLKDSVYMNNPHTIQELQVNITENIANITQNELMGVFQNMHRRVNACISVHGAHFQHLL